MKTLNQIRFFLLLIISLYGSTFCAQNVGIGTNTPDKELTVVGTIKSEMNSTVSSGHIEVHENGNDFGRIIYTNTTGSQNFTLAGNPQTDPDLARFHIYNSDFGNIGSFTGHGRFGINATSPAATLHLNSQSNTDLLRVQNNGNTKLRVFSNNAMVFGSNWQTPIEKVIRMETPNLFIGFDGNHVPEDRLEVDGDVRITGGIKADTEDGSPGQMLITGADGNIAWANPCGYSRFAGFVIAGSVQWTVPDAVTEISVELWGAGGGGALGGGGGSGGYVKAIYKVSPGEVLTVVTGSGGDGVSNGAIMDATDGGSSSITGSNVLGVALGGKGATTTEIGDGGAFSVSQPYLSATAIPGKPGGHNLTVPIFSGTDKIIRGNGGQSPNAEENYGRGDIIIQAGTSLTANEGSSGQSFGGGGGGGHDFNNKGGDGYVIIRWN